MGENFLETIDKKIDNYLMVINDKQILVEPENLKKEIKQYTGHILEEILQNLAGNIDSLKAKVYCKCGAEKIVDIEGDLICPVYKDALYKNGYYAPGADKEQLTEEHKETCYADSNDLREYKIKQGIIYTFNKYGINLR
jgi:hypothetical protein